MEREINGFGEEEGVQEKVEPGDYQFKMQEIGWDTFLLAHNTTRFTRRDESQ